MQSADLAVSEGKSVPDPEDLRQGRHWIRLAEKLETLAADALEGALF